MSDVVDGNVLFRFRYGAGQERNFTFRFKSSDGKNYNSFEADVHSGSKCLVTVRESALRHGVPQHCAFLYDLLCGTSSKYQISDSSCLADKATTSFWK
ncbi:hypothetical protein MTO96_040621 [Rhipicephalus appendiculatus]